MNAWKSLRDWAASSTIAHVGFAFIVMGGWAFFINRDHPAPRPLMAGLVQGAISALLTLVLKTFLQWMSATFWRDGSALALLVAPLITATSILVILIGAHTIAGTPEIAATIAVPFTVSTTYAVLYNWKLWRGRRQ